MADLESHAVGEADEAKPRQPLMTPDEVAEIFRVSKQTLARWTRQGRIPAVKIVSGHSRYRRSDIDRLLGESDEEGDEA